MQNIIKIQTPLTKEKVKQLKAGDNVSISGTIYTARDAAHKRMISLIEEGKSLPFDVKDQIIYYVGPCPARPGQVIGSAGPTTSGRMDAYAPTLISMGLTGMIGKGLRSKEVIDSMIKYGAVYFGAIGGAGALIASTIESEEVIAFPDLGTEAIRKLVVRDFPATVVIDCYGNNLYEIGRKRYMVAE
ncbi:MAG TPA: Fe-S-containing hydro-lyase [Clostridiaceae bacterium]|nr:Fe-S-containing hydro-lyase [Clostridiaceae bacterium]